MMVDQLELFSGAIEHKQAALAALQNFELQQAKTELQVAYGIDPYLADLGVLQKTVDVLLHFKLDTGSSPARLAQAWRSVRQPAADLPHIAQSIIEPLICARVIELLPKQYTGFADADGNVLHVGYCHQVLHQYVAAYEKLLDYLTAHSGEEHPVLWGVFGDVSYKLNHFEESNGGYLRALLMDPQAVDPGRFQHPGLQRIYKELQEQHSEQIARALTPIQGWLENVLSIPRGKTWLSRMIDKSRLKSEAEPLSSLTQRYHQFALCLYSDQSGLRSDIDFDARIEMQKLDVTLFNSYLKEVAKRAEKKSLGRFKKPKR